MGEVFRKNCRMGESPLPPTPPMGNPEFGISTSNISCVPIFSQNGFFGLNLGKLPNYVQYFGSNIVEGVAESWVEAEMSWVEVDGAGWRLK